MKVLCKARRVGKILIYHLLIFFARLVISLINALPRERELMNKINPTIKKLVNKNFNCFSCADYNNCRFGNGEDFGCADEAADGMQIAFNYLAEIPRNEAMKEIIKVIKS